ncbi:alcohol oxidase-like protein [Artomyces pyxidatus]|uniref:Alcohol oxidase-like protein n=1 Tax=Artomyces pyxidatus TaxID=48021 RepID=A0ACB8TC06_9AGAM|nr:alcohol oxidase-like protein [Artomyces pyxidatus]
MSSTPSYNAEYDLILAGGGTAAGVIAGRLSVAAPHLRILMLEAGPSTRDDLMHTQPARYLNHLTPTSTTARFHVSKPSAALNGRPAIVPCGQCLGGGSSINFIMYTRASKSDYDDWETEFGNKGWGSADLIPLLQKTETYQAQPDAPTHGYSGPLKVSYGGIFTNVGQQCFAAAQAIDSDRQLAHGFVEPNDLTSVNVFGRWPKWIDAEKGTRSDVPHHFIYPQEHNPNLTVITGAHVRRVTFDEDNRASGVQFVWNYRFYPEADHDVHTVKATRLVVVSAGTFGSPGILERSGIGSPEILGRFDIETRVDLPGVGEEYQDHNVMFVPYKTTPEAETIDPIIRNETDVVSGISDEWFKTGQGLMAHNSIDFGFKMRPTAAELDAFGPAFRPRWESYYADKPDKAVLFVGALAMLVADPTTVPLEKYYTMAFFSNYPVARGYVHITDKDDAAAPTDFSSGFVESMADVAPLMWAYKYTREIARRMPLFRGEYTPLHPKYSQDSPAAILEGVDGPVPADAPLLVYSAEDDAAVEQYVRDIVQTTWHSMGTCAMKAREAGGVVDFALNVYGVKGLKVADMSICPGNVGSNTYSTALVVAEKAALIIADELGIAGV